jgi:hypothetical protein
MKRRIEKDDNESNKRQKKSIRTKRGRGGEATMWAPPTRRPGFASGKARVFARTIINIYSFNSLSQENYNVIFEQTGDYRSLFSLLFVSKRFNEFTKQFLNDNYKNEIKSKYYTNLFCNYLGETNQIGVLKWLHSIGCLFSPKIFYIVSSNNNDNNLDLLKWLLKIFEPKDSILEKTFIKKYKRKDRFLEKIIYGAAQENDQNILFFIKERYFSTASELNTSKDLTLSQIIGQSPDQEEYLYLFFKFVGMGASKGNQLMLLESIIYPKKDAHLCAKKEKLPSTEGLFYKKIGDSRLLSKASKHGNLEILKFYTEKILPEHFSLFARPGLAIDIFITAFEYGHVKIMEWLIIEKEYINKNNLFQQVDQCGGEKIEGYFYYICKKAILKGSICSLEWAFNRNILFKKDDCLGPKLFQWASKKGRVDFLNSLKLLNLEYDDSACAGAALGGSFECLQWAIENGHPTSFWVSACAASKGNIKVLEWLHENKHPINFISTAFSILNGYERTTRWLMDHGFSLNSKDLIFVFSEKNLGRKSKKMRDNIRNRQKFYSYWINNKKKDF